MSNANPTPIRVGMTGTFAGKPYTIIARVVMGMEEEGETYYWNEFYLSDGSDRIAMLVCEEVYGAQQWRLFTEFTPQQPLNAREAGLKKVGDRVSLDGVSAEVTVVDETRVYFIEGKAPDWVSVGDVAQYFNAEAGGKMWVVSWSGDEVEYYRGLNLHGELVAQALGLPAGSFRSASGSSSSSSASFIGLGSALATFAVVGFFLFRGCSDSRSLTRYATRSPPPAPPPVVARQPAPPPPLTVGTNVVLDGRSYQVITHRVTGFTKVNSQWNTHHYQVADDSGQTNLLAVRLQSASPSLHLFKQHVATRPPTPSVAAAMRVGEKVTLDDYEGTVTELLMSHEVSRTGPPIAGLGTNGLTYHYLATGTNGMLLASWNGERIVFHRGMAVAKMTP
ncbi:MAG: hypothetical protein FD161_2156 [Limisphaerales bacterium]|nr:MAG: hypothetical protein FD161_2156 [Limisphaerales bacterium]KAG0508862.1 MAG: hypothetical protein E1N63_1958 [Limisphaerales bacterium]TXT50203.1 MAG: hypothetical protein FD140_2471 [Limisphaerales bacterium]